MQSKRGNGLQVGGVRVSFYRSSICGEICTSDCILLGYIWKKGGIKTVLVKRLIRSACMRYGLPVRDDKENITIDLLLGIMKKIKLSDALDLCCMAASVIGFLNCLRCVEFTLHPAKWTRKDWKQDETRGQIPPIFENRHNRKSSLDKISESEIEYRPNFLDAETC